VRQKIGHTPSYRKRFRENPLVCGGRPKQLTRVLIRFGERPKYRDFEGPAFFGARFSASLRGSWSCSLRCAPTVSETASFAGRRVSAHVARHLLLTEVDLAAIAVLPDLMPQTLNCSICGGSPIASPEERVRGTRFTCRKCTARVARRKGQIMECGQIDLGEVNGTEDLQSYVAEIEESPRAEHNG
jgi:hypothetical protein